MIINKFDIVKVTYTASGYCPDVGSIGIALANRDSKDFDTVPVMWADFTEFNHSTVVPLAKSSIVVIENLEVVGHISDIEIGDTVRVMSISSNANYSPMIGKVVGKRGNFVDVKNEDSQQTFNYLLLIKVEDYNKLLELAKLAPAKPDKLNRFLI